MLYDEKVLKLFNSKKHIGSMDRDDPNVGTGLVGAPACGDVMKLQMRVENGKIVEVKYKTFGCAAAMASSAYAAEIIEGKGTEDAAKISNQEIAEHLKLPPVKIHCSCLAEEAIKAACQDLEKKQKALKEKALEEKRKHMSENLEKTSQKQQKQMFVITDNACEFLKKMGCKKAVISTKTHGCSGTSYELEPANSTHQNLQSVSKNGIQIFVHPTAVMFVVNMTIDYESRDDWEGLIFKNPNETGRCKCGDSFYTN